MTSIEVSIDDSYLNCFDPSTFKEKERGGGGIFMIQTLSDEYVSLFKLL